MEAPWTRIGRWFDSRSAATEDAADDSSDRDDYGLVLLVRRDESAGRLAPSVQLRGTGVLTRPWIRLELVDRDGRLRLAVTKSLTPFVCGTEFPLRPFEPPEGATVEEVLGWHWDVVIEDEAGCERARWREHPCAVGGLNPEAELIWR